MMNNKFFNTVISSFILLLCAFTSLYGKSDLSSDHSIVFIHIGKSIPSHVSIALLQARAFNPDCPIIFVANEEALRDFSLNDSQANITYIFCESLNKTEEHIKFSNKSGLNSHWREGFWLYTSERFLYLNDLIVQHGLKNVFHMEHDNMLYVDLKELLPIFKAHYPGLGITMDNDDRCIPGIVFIRNVKAMRLLASFFADTAGENNNDMQTLSKFKKIYGSHLTANLPVTTQEYVDTQSLVTPSGKTTKNKNDYCLHVDLFQSIFDAAAIGQYLGGTDPRNGLSAPGFINEACVFNPSLLTYEWIIDDMERKVPFAVYANKKYRINNIHVHSKNLLQFASTSFE
jgi:hypothetical protein